MKRRQLVALFMAATLTITGIGEAVVVSGADFSDATVLEEFTSEEITSQETEERPMEEALQDTQTENLETEEEIFFSDEVLDEKEVVISQEQETEENDEPELFSAGMASVEEENLDIAGYNMETMPYSGIYISGSDFEEWKNTGAVPDLSAKVYAQSFIELLNQGSESEKYLLLEKWVSDDPIIVPQGVNVGFLHSSDTVPVLPGDITAEGTVVIRGCVAFGSNVLNIGSGKGTIIFRDCETGGSIWGPGFDKDSLVEFQGSVNRIGGLGGVRKVLNGSSDLYTNEAVEFFEFSSTSPYFCISVNNGYAPERIPVFNQGLSLKGIDSLVINYLENGACIQLPDNAQAVSFGNLEPFFIEQICEILQINNGAYAVDVSGYINMSQNPEYDVWFEGLRDGDNTTWLFTDEFQEVCLNTSKLPEGYRIEWIVGRYDETKDIVIPFTENELYTVSEDTSFITLNGEAIKAYQQSHLDEFVNGNNFTVDASVYVDNQLVNGRGCGVILQEPEYKYYFPEECSMHPGSDMWVDKNLDCYIENSQWPNGNGGVVEITDVSAQILEGASDALVVEREELGWRLRVNSYGYADVIVSYIPAEGDQNNPGKYTFRIWMEKDIWGVDLHAEPNDDRLRPGDTLDLTADSWHSYYEEETGVIYEKANVDFEWSGFEGFENVLSFEQDHELPEKCHIKIREDAENGCETGIEVHAYLLDETGHRVKHENGEDMEVAYNNFRIYINYDYFKIAPVDISNQEFEPGIAQTFTPVLTHYYVDEKGQRQENEITEEAELRFEWNPEAVELRDSGGRLLTPENNSIKITESITITKIYNNYEEIRVVAFMPDQEGRQEEICAIHWNLHELDYSAWIDGLRENGWGWIYTDEDQRLSLNTENLKNRSYATEWAIGTINEETGVFTAFENDKDLFTVTEGNPNEIVLHGKKIEGCSEIIPDQNENKSFVIRTIIRKQNDSGVILNEIFTGMDLRKPYYEYYLPGNMDLHPEENIDIQNKIGCYVENAENPYGQETETAIENVVVELLNGTENAVEIEKNSTGWVIHANGYGQARVTVTYQLLDGDRQNTGSHSFEVNVSQDIWCVIITPDRMDNRMLPGAEMNLNARVWSSHYDEITKSISWEPVKAKLEWEGLPDYENVLSFTVDQETPEICHIIANENAEEGWGAGIKVIATPLDEKGDPIPDVKAYADFWINIQYSYTHVDAVNSIIVEPGESFGLEALEASLYQFDLENPDGVEIPNAACYVEEWETTNKNWLTISEDKKRINVISEHKVEDQPVDTPVMLIASDDKGHEDRKMISVIICKHDMEVTEHKDEDCMADGIHKERCKKCGKEIEEILKAPGQHVFINYKFDNNATCTRNGTETAKCERCAATHTRVKSGTMKAHQWGGWQKTVKATVFAAEQQKHTCRLCGKTEYKTGSKLKPILSVPSTSFSMKVRQKTKSFRVTMADGDSVVSWKSSNTKCIKVSGKANGTCVITAQKKNGKAYITINLKSGLQKKVKITVQGSNVKTKSIKGISKSAVLEKRKTLTLKPVLNPFTSMDKITYATSNKKVASVSKKGVVKAVGAGTAVITVRAGSRKATCKLTVPGMTNIKSSENLKKGKTFRLMPKKYGIKEKITYTSSNPKVASVSSKGVVKARKKGTAVITIKAGKYSVKCRVKVK